MVKFGPTQQSWSPQASFVKHRPGQHWYPQRECFPSWQGEASAPCEVAPRRAPPSTARQAARRDRREPNRRVARSKACGSIGEFLVAAQAISSSTRRIDHSLRWCQLTSADRTKRIVTAARSDPPPHPSIRPRAVRSRQSIASSRAVRAVLMSRSSWPRLGGTDQRSSFPGPRRTSSFVFLIKEEGRDDHSHHVAIARQPSPGVWSS